MGFYEDKIKDVRFIGKDIGKDIWKRGWKRSFRLHDKKDHRFENLAKGKYLKVTKI